MHEPGKNGKAKPEVGLTLSLHQSAVITCRHGAPTHEPSKNSEAEPEVGLAVSSLSQLLLKLGAAAPAAVLMQPLRWHLSASLLVSWCLCHPQTLLSLRKGPAICSQSQAMSDESASAFLLPFSSSPLSPALVGVWPAVDTQARRSSEMIPSAEWISCAIVLLLAFSTSDSDFHHKSTFCNSKAACVYRSTLRLTSVYSCYEVSAAEPEVMPRTHMASL